MSRPKNIQAHPSPKDFGAMQLTYEQGNSRRVIFLPKAPAKAREPEPQGAGSFHNPEHHQILLDRVEALLR
jgi:hypothetical protein